MYGNYCGSSCRPRRGGDKPLLIGSENMRWPGQADVLTASIHTALKIVFLGGWSDRRFL